MNVEFKLHDKDEILFDIDMELTKENKELLEKLIPSVLNQYLDPAAPVNTAPEGTVKAEVTAKVTEPVVKKTVLPAAIKAKPDVDSYMGFMFLRCGGCGKRHVFNSRNLITERACDCGETITLYKLKSVDFTCTNCSHSWFYRTNIDTADFPVKCKECGTFNTVSYDPRTDRYVGEQSE